ncbi:MAG: DUF6629 family protein [Saprospiraceae bacterium]
MCFSTTASIGAGVALGLIGTLSVKKVKDPTQYALAALPLLFSVQQFAEGAVWMSLTHSGWESYKTVASIGFLIIAQALWPICLPIAMLNYEKDENRKKIIRIFLAAGIIVACYFVVNMFILGVDASIINDHIYYTVKYPRSIMPFAAGLYLAATIGPPLLTRNRKVQAMGILIMISYLITRLYFQPALVSVWCFFGTAIGILIYAVLSEKQTSRETFAMAMNDRGEHRA